MSKILFFDLETTGLDSKIHAIHQMSGMLQVDGKVVQEFNWSFRPDYGEVTSEALAVSNLTIEEVMAREMTSSDAYRNLLGLLHPVCDKYNKKDKVFLCGYNNASFDNQFLRAFFSANGDDYFGSWFWSNSLDVMVYASMLLSKKRPQMENFKLMTVAKTLGIEVDDSQLHDALYDVRLTKEIFEICMKTWYKKVSPPAIALRFLAWESNMPDDYRMDEIHEFMASEDRGSIFELLDWASSFLKPKQ